MRIDNWYFDWLMSKAGVDADENPSGYSHLCWILLDTPFIPVHPMDGNRWADGMAYRERFADMYTESDGYSCDTDENRRELVEELRGLLGGCTMLELLLSLSERMTFEMLESRFEADRSKWFHELLDNLGLLKYTNECIIMHDDAYYEIRDILERLNLRKYRPNGVGGLFPLRAWRSDQRNEELLTQMNYYLSDRYDIL